MKIIPKTFSHYWSIRTVKNPSLGKKGKVTISIAEFKKEAERAFDAGKAVSQMGSQNSGSSFEDIMGSFFK